MEPCVCSALRLDGDQIDEAKSFRRRFFLINADFALHCSSDHDDDLQKTANR